MAQIIASPSRYIQGKGEIRNLCSYAQNYGKKLCILVSASGKKRVETVLLLYLKFLMANAVCRRLIVS